jgi:hypothetical protein
MRRRPEASRARRRPRRQRLRKTAAAPAPGARRPAGTRRRSTRSTGRRSGGRRWAGAPTRPWWPPPPARSAGQPSRVSPTPGRAGSAHGGGLSPGVVSEADFIAMKNEAHGRRPFVQVRGPGVCPAPPSPTNLVDRRGDEATRAKVVQIAVPRCLAAYRNGCAAALVEDPRIAVGHRKHSTSSRLFAALDYGRRSVRAGAANVPGGSRRRSVRPHRTGLALESRGRGRPPPYGVISTRGPEPAASVADARRTSGW